MHKKLFIINIIVFILILFISSSSNKVFASKKELENGPNNSSKSGYDNGYTTDEFIKMVTDLDTNNDKELTLDELRNASDKQLNSLAYPSGNQALTNKNIASMLTKSADAITTAYNEARERNGLDPMTTGTGLSGSSGMEKYYSPENKGTTASSKDSLEDMINDADDFLQSADKGDAIATVEASELQKFSNVLYNIVLTIGTAITVIVGLIIGIKYMLGSIEEKANLKQLLLPYAVGSVVIFGSFAIWKMILEIMQSL